MKKTKYAFTLSLILIVLCSIIFTSCGDNSTALDSNGNELDENEWKKDLTTEVVEVTNPVTGRIWMDRNLGASRQAISRYDEEASGDLYQWGREADRHEKRSSEITSEISSSSRPGHEYFIVSNDEPFDWIDPQRDDLWQGVNGINNPCPDGFRIPTEDELLAELESWEEDNSAGAFSSPLKFTALGGRGGGNGYVGGVGTGYYFSSTIDGTDIRKMGMTGSFASVGTSSRNIGSSIRCIKN